LAQSLPLTRWRRKRIAPMSDDGFLVLQRNLLLQFALVGE
jgi:hypothetical protein